MWQLYQNKPQKTPKLGKRWQVRFAEVCMQYFFLQTKTKPFLVHILRQNDIALILHSNVKYLVSSERSLDEFVFVMMISVYDVRISL